MSHFHIANFGVSNALRVFLFLAMAHPALAVDADVARAGMERPAQVPSAAAAPSTSDTAPESAPVGFGWG